MLVTSHQQNGMTTAVAPGTSATLIPNAMEITVMIVVIMRRMSPAISV
jgi:hypothetical protein